MLALLSQKKEESDPEALKFPILTFRSIKDK
jgi:hypothetical protein